MLEPSTNQLEIHIIVHGLGDINPLFNLVAISDRSQHSHRGHAVTRLILADRSL